MAKSLYFKLKTLNFSLPLPKNITLTMMKTTIFERDGEAIAQFEGRLDTTAAAQTEQDLKPLYETTCSAIVLDCSELQYISSSGLRLFLGLLKASKPKGIHVIISSLNNNLRQVFAMTGFTSLFEFR